MDRARPDEKIFVIVHMNTEYPFSENDNLTPQEKCNQAKVIAFNSQSALVDYLKSLPESKAEIVRQFWVFNGLHLKATKDVIKELAKRNDIWFISSNVKMKCSFEPQTIEESNVLGLPGIHIQDEKIAAKCFQKHSTYEVYQSYVQNHGLEGFHQPEYIFQKLNEFCIKNIHSEHINLYVTHDILLAIWIYAYNGKVYHPPKWIDFLTGFIIKHYDERKFEIVIY
ncbi:MAG: hypothetical protein ABIL07_08055 [candidate division WOR-3 bacterium]